MPTRGSNPSTRRAATFDRAFDGFRKRVKEIERLLLEITVPNDAFGIQTVSSVDGATLTVVMSFHLVERGTPVSCDIVRSSGTSTRDIRRLRALKKKEMR